jgi:hypothetical protein
MAKQKSQIDKFREAAREAGTDESEDAFNATLKNLAKSPREAKGHKELPSSAHEGETGVSPHQKPKKSN